MSGSGTDDIAGAYERAVARVMARSAVSQGTITDQHAGDAAAELGLRRTAALLAALGDPQRTMAIVHVAGSKGKGSTVAMIASILTEAGVRTGRFMSPHLHHLTERIAIDRVDIDRTTFAAVAGRVLAAVEALERDRPELGRVHAFEVLFAMALVRFRDAGCAVGVIEVGIGGRLDTTNVVEPAVSVITTLDLEHTAILGDTLAKIAWEKAGIVKPGRPVVTVPHPEAAMAVIRARAAAVGSALTVIATVDPSDMDAVSTLDRSLPNEQKSVTRGGVRHLKGAVERLNARLAVAAVGLLAPIIGLVPPREGSVLWGLWSFRLPGRLESSGSWRLRNQALDDTLDEAASPIDEPEPGRPAEFPFQRLEHLRDAYPLIHLDAAHTPGSARAQREALAYLYAKPPPHVNPGVLAIVGMTSGHDVEAFLRELRPEMVLPVAADSPRSISAAAVASAAMAVGCPVVAGPETVGNALRWAVRHDDRWGRIIVTGSFLVVAEARVALGLADGPA